MELQAQFQVRIELDWSYPERMVKKRTQRRKKFKESGHSIISDEINIPNHSGMLDAGKVHRTPTDELDPVNKKYVDDLTTPPEHPHQDVRTTASPEFVNITITDPVVPWKFMKTQINVAGNTELALQSQTSGAATRFGLFSKDGDGTDNVFFHLYASGRPDDRTGENRIDYGFNKVSDVYIINAGKELFIDGFGGLHLSTNGELTTIGGDVILTDGDLKVRRSKITKAGGFGILLMNSSVSTIDANHLVMASTSESNSFDLTVINALNAIGVTEISVDSEEEEFIITTGMHFVMIDGEFTFGDRLITSSTNEGHAEVNNNPAVAVHFQEIGHCLESGENEIGNVALHFN